jgi:hypothetical protein
MDSKTRGWIYIIGALVAGWLGWQARDWAILILSLLFLLTGYHHAMQRK